MKITIELPDQYVEPLSRWASVSRTLTNAASLIDDHVALDADEWDTAGELRELEPPLNALHQAVRNELWRLATL